MFGLRFTALLVIAAAILTAPAFYLGKRSQKSSDRAPLAIATAYLHALYARDLHAAYGYLSAADKSAQAEDGYVKSQPVNRGFGLRLARRLAAYGEVRALSRSDGSSRARIELAYNYPAQEDLAGIVYNWDMPRLNALTAREQEEILKTLAARQRSGKLIMVKGRETFDLVKEPDGWKVFLNWASGVKVHLAASPSSGVIETRFAQREMIVNSDAPFQVNLVLRNTGAKRAEIAIVHKIEPKRFTDDLMMIECGLSQPVTLEPGAEREFTMAYLLSEGARSTVKEIKLSYILRPRTSRRT